MNIPFDAIIVNNNFRLIFIYCFCLNLKLSLWIPFHMKWKIDFFLNKVFFLFSCYILHFFHKKRYNRKLYMMMKNKLFIIDGLSSEHLGNGISGVDLAGFENGILISGDELLVKDGKFSNILKFVSGIIIPQVVSPAT